MNDYLARNGARMGDPLNHATRALANAVRILAQEVAPGDLVGDALQRQGKYPDAIRSCGDAWKNAR